MTKRSLCCRIDTSKVAGLLKAISEPNRLRLICLLRRGKRCVCELQSDTGLKHNLLCHHLKALGKLGIIKAAHKNQFTYYELNTKEFRKMLKDMNVLLGGK